MHPSVVAPWGMDWVWSLPLIVTTVIIHVIGLMLIFRGFVGAMRGAIVRRRVVPMFVLSMGSGPRPIECLAHYPTTGQRCYTRSAQ
jgi:hypothetical protein